MDLEGQVKQWTPEQRQLVFPTTAGGIVRYPHFLESVWRPLLAKAATSHSCATWLLSDGADLHLGTGPTWHATIAQNSDTYGHVQLERHEAAVAGLDRYLL